MTGRRCMVGSSSRGGLGQEGCRDGRSERRHVGAGDTAVDEEGVGGHEAGLVAGEEQDSVGHLFRLTEAAHGDMDEAAGSTLERARELGIPVIDAPTLMNMIGQEDA